MLRDWLWFVAVALVAGAACFVFADVVNPEPFNYDEADYMYAGTRGIAANFLDRPSQTLPEFIRVGLQLSRDKTRRQGISEYVRETGDITFYRHYHGPVYAYWIAIVKAAGAASEKAYRGSGLVMHAFLSLAMFWLFRWVFPGFSPIAAFVAAVMYAMNRTAIETATIITQHEPFTVLAALALFVLAIFIRSGDRRYWYSSAALAAIAFGTVEISVVLIGCLILTAAIVHRRDGVKAIARLIGKGVVAFLVTLVVIWPRSILSGAAVKGFLYLAYIAVYRKTFTPIGPLQLWGFKLKTYPLEFIPLALALVAVFVGYRWLSYRKETLPFLLYALMFLGVTMVVTAPFTYYHCSLVMAAAVLCGVAFGELWKRKPIIGGVVLAALLGALVMLDMSRYAEAQEEVAAPSMAADVLAYLKANPAAGKMVFVPFVMVPPLHYYLPELKTTGFDVDWTADRLRSEVAAAGPSTEVLCPDSVCRYLDGAQTKVVGEDRVSRVKDTGEALWALHIQ